MTEPVRIRVAAEKPYDVVVGRGLLGDIVEFLKGTAKIFGPERPLALWLLRRPLAYLRQLVA